MTAARKVNQKKREHKAAEEMNIRTGWTLNLTSCPPGRFWVQLHWQNQTPDGKPNVSEGRAQKVRIYTFGVAVLRRHRSVWIQAATFPGYFHILRNNFTTQRAQATYQVSVPHLHLNKKNKCLKWKGLKTSFKIQTVHKQCVWKSDT